MERTATTVARSLRKKLIRKAHDHPELRSALLPVIAKMDNPDLLKVAGMDLPVRVALDLREARFAAGVMDLDRMPGFSGMQLRQQIDRIGQVQRELKILTTQYEEAIKQMGELEKEERAGLAKLKDAAGEMREKGKYCAQAEDALLEFTAYLTDKRPGIEQMIARPDDKKFGDKAGDFFGRVAAQLGEDVSRAVGIIYEATKEDLTHSTMAVRGLKVVQKTAGLDPRIIKQAGLTDMIVGVKEWLAGKARGFMGLVGDIGRWLKGFVERTKMVSKSTSDLTSALQHARKEIDKALA